MSSLLYGTLTHRRQMTPPQTDLAYRTGPATPAPVPAGPAPGDRAGAPPGAPPGTTGATTDAPPPETTAKARVSHWQDIAAGLVPAEVLAVHSVAMSFGTTTTGSGADAITRISHPGEMMVVYVAMMVLAAALYLFGARTVRDPLTWVRALIPVAAFVIWTMIQPSTAFDAFPFGITSFARTMIAVFGAILLGALVNTLATRADNKDVSAA